MMSSLDPRDEPTKPKALMMDQKSQHDDSGMDMALMLYNSPTGTIVMLLYCDWLTDCTFTEERSIPESPVEIISPSLALLPAVEEPMEVDDRTVAIPGDKTVARQCKYLSWSGLKHF